MTLKLDKNSSFLRLRMIQEEGESSHHDSLQSHPKELDQIFQWSKKWHTLFLKKRNGKLCIVEPEIVTMCITRWNPVHVVHKERELGVIVSSDLKHWMHNISACKRVDTILGLFSTSPITLVDRRAGSDGAEREKVIYAGWAPLSKFLCVHKRLLVFTNLRETLWGTY